jgi:hypothetical protein
MNRFYAYPTKFIWMACLATAVLVSAAQGWGRANASTISIMMEDEPAAFSTSPDWVFSFDQKGAEVGYSVGTAGDVNGDGYADLIIGSPKYDSETYRGGTAQVFYGSADGLSKTPDWQTGGPQKGSRYGSAVSTAGDVNGDGFADVLVGAYRMNGLMMEEGAVFVYYGSQAGLSTTPEWFYFGGQSGATFAYAVSLAGDLNGDGYGDIVIGAPMYTSQYGKEGAVFVFYGSENGLPDTPDFVFYGGQPNAQLGYAVNQAGDVNGDGYDDIVVGAPYFNGGSVTTGAIFIFFGSETGLSSTRYQQIRGAQDGAMFGASVSTAGDVNWDGYDDIIAGAPQFSTKLAGAGAAFLFTGQPAGVTGSPVWDAYGDQEYSGFGISVCTAGGFVDKTSGLHKTTGALVGAHLYRDDQPAEGRVSLFSAGPQGLSLQAEWTADGNKADAGFGYAVNTAGDLNGDGFDDLVVGAPLYRQSMIITGRAFVFYSTAHTTEYFYYQFIPFIQTTYLPDN